MHRNGKLYLNRLLKRLLLLLFFKLSNLVLDLLIALVDHERLIEQQDSLVDLVEFFSDSCHIQ